MARYYRCAAWCQGNRLLKEHEVEAVVTSVQTVLQCTHCDKIATEELVGEAQPDDIEMLPIIRWVQQHRSQNDLRRGTQQFAERPKSRLLAPEFEFRPQLRNPCADHGLQRAAIARFMSDHGSEIVDGLFRQSDQLGGNSGLGGSPQHSL